MKSRFCLVTALLLAAPVGPLPAADLTRIDRTIAKEPAYQTKAPRYCLLVFGPEAKTRAWLVLDGDVLYADRNSDGDLTDMAERIQAQRTTDTQDDFLIGTIAGSGAKAAFSNVDLSRYGKDRRLVIGADIGGKYRQQTVCDLGDGRLQFAARPQDAPVVHFGGSLTMCLSRPVEFIPGKEEEVYLKVGTRGLGKGTFAAIPHDAVPKGLKAVVEIEFPAEGHGGKPIRRRYELPRRC